MREYIISLGAVMILTSFMKLLLPEGGIKKFASLAAGFMIISAVITPFEFDFKNIFAGEIHNYKNAENEAIYRAEVLKKHRENLREIIKSKMKHGGEAFVETDNDGNIVSVTLKCKGDESAAVMYITESLGVKRERIRVYDDN